MFNARMAVLVSGYSFGRLVGFRSDRAWMQQVRHTLFGRALEAGPTDKLAAAVAARLLH